MCLTHLPRAEGLCGEEMVGEKSIKNLIELYARH